MCEEREDKLIIKRVWISKEEAKKSFPELDNTLESKINICTCHISELRCKNERCNFVKSVRESFKSELASNLEYLFEMLHKHGFTKKESIRALRRECNYRNNFQCDIFDVMATSIWGEE